MGGWDIKNKEERRKMMIELRKLKEELKYKESLKKIVESNELRNREFWDADEENMNSFVLKRLNMEIRSLKKELSKKGEM